MDRTPGGPPDDTAPGQQSYPTLASYRLLHLLGEGGMGRVYLGKHLVTGAMVAVKVLRPEFVVSNSAVRRFLAEAQTLRRIGHPNIVRIEEVVLSEHGGGPLFYVMEYLTGIDLKRELQAGFLPLLRVVDIALQVCAALQAVHQAGVIHRDLKPGNIFLVQRDPGEELVKILDFGLAKLEPEFGGTNTTSGHLMGTPAYMSPEQASGERVDRRSDIYSLGVILFEMFTGRRPFEANSFGAYVVHHLSTVPLRPSELSPPGIPIAREVDQIVLRCLEKSPARRYGNAAEIAADLRALLPRKTMASMAVAPIGQRSFRPSRKRVKLGVGAVLGLGALFGLSALLGARSSRRADSAEPAAPRTVSAAERAHTSPARPLPAAPSDAGLTSAAPRPRVRAPEQPIAGRRPQPSKQAATRRKAKRPSEAGHQPAQQGSLDHVTMDPF